MPHYIPDPENPGQRIDVIEWIRKNPLDAPPPTEATELLKRDYWTRAEALRVLAGYHPRTVIDPEGHPVDHVFLDGTSGRSLAMAGLRHPLEQEILADYWALGEYSLETDQAEQRTPDEWLAWAESKGFKPYWLDSVSGDKPQPKSGGWEAEARQHYEALKRQHPKWTNDRLAKEIAAVMQTRGRGGRRVSPETIRRRVARGG